MLWAPLSSWTRKNRDSSVGAPRPYSFPRSILPGPSSNIAFLRQISQAALNTSNVTFQSPQGDTSSETFRDGGLFNFSRLDPPQSNLNGKRQEKVDIFAIPPESQVMDLLHRYFSYPGYFFPYVHEDTFMETYQQIKNAKHPSVRRSWLGLFNVILAMAVSTTIDNNVDAVERFQESDIYYQRAYGLCGKLMLRGTSLEIGLLFNLLVGLTLTIFCSSTISATHGTVPSGNSKIDRSLGRPWIGSQGSNAIRTPFE